MLVSHVAVEALQKQLSVCVQHLCVGHILVHCSHDYLQTTGRSKTGPFTARDKINMNWRKPEGCKFKQKKKKKETFIHIPAAAARQRLKFFAVPSKYN